MDIIPSLTLDPCVAFWELHQIRVIGENIASGGVGRSCLEEQSAYGGGGIEAGEN